MSLGVPEKSQNQCLGHEPKPKNGFPPRIVSFTNMANLTIYIYIYEKKKRS